MTAILFGSISTIADTSELQREAFNAAFEEHGLDWQWDQEDYRAMLGSNGGANRVADFASERGEEVDAAAVHKTKSERFQQTVGERAPQLRQGVADTVRAAKDAGVKVALVTTTSAANIDALMGALAPELSAADFDLVVDGANVDEPKPDDAVYRFALEELGEQPDRCVAIEDNVGGVKAATAAGIACVAFPNQNTAGHEFATAQRRVDHLDLDELRQLIR